MDWRQLQLDFLAAEKLDRARMAREHVSKYCWSDLQSDFVFLIFAKGKIETENEITRSVLTTSVRALTTSLQCSIGGLADAERKLIERGVLRKEVHGQRGTTYTLSWPRLFGWRRGVRSCSVVFGSVRSSSSSCSCKKETIPPPPPRKKSLHCASWEVAEAEVAKELADWTTPIAVARRHVTPDYVLAVVHHYRSAEGAWGAGALHARLLQSHPDAAPDNDRTWPPKRPTRRPRRRSTSGMRYKIISSGRKAGKSDDEIELELSRAGLEW